jgi:hypothetical protein
MNAEPSSLTDLLVSNTNALLMIASTVVNGSDFHR